MVCGTPSSYIRKFDSFSPGTNSWVFCRITAVSTVTTGTSTRSEKFPIPGGFLTSGFGGGGGSGASSSSLAGQSRRCRRPVRPRRGCSVWLLCGRRLLRLLVGRRLRHRGSAQDCHCKNENCHAERSNPTPRGFAPIPSHSKHYRPIGGSFAASALYQLLCRRGNSQESNNSDEILLAAGLMACNTLPLRAQSSPAQSGVITSGAVIPGAAQTPISLPATPPPSAAAEFFRSARCIAACALWPTPFLKARNPRPWRLKSSASAQRPRPRPGHDPRPPRRRQARIHRRRCRHERQPRLRRRQAARRALLPHRPVQQGTNRRHHANRSRCSRYAISLSRR